MGEFYCATEGCETEATDYYLHEDGRVRPMCRTCASVFEAGQANPEAVVSDIDDLGEDGAARHSCYSCGKLFPRDEVFEDGDGYLFCEDDWYTHHEGYCHKCGWSFAIHNDDGSCVDDGEDDGPIDVGVPVYYRVFVHDEYLFTQEWDEDEIGDMAWLNVISPEYAGPDADALQRVDSAALDLSRQVHAYVAAYNTERGLKGDFIVYDPGVIKSDDAAVAARKESEL